MHRSKHTHKRHKDSPGYSGTSVDDESKKKKANYSDTSCIEDQEKLESTSSKEYLKCCEPNFPWQKYKSTLTKIFFGIKGKIKK